MSTKSNLQSYQLVTNGDMSLASITSPVTNIATLDNVGIQFDFTGSPVGAFQVQISADYSQDTLGNVLNAGHWVSIPFSVAPVAAGEAGDIYLDLNQLSAPWIRAVYTKTSGTGTLQAFITAKRV